VDQAVAIAIFAVSLGLIFAEWLHRVIVAIAGAIAMLVAGLVLGFYSEEQALESVDFTTILLLLGMMIVVALFEPTGFFEYLALRAGQISRGRPFMLFLLLGAVTTVLSMFLDNVTTVVVIAPVTLVIARVLRLPAAPLLMAEAMLSNVGGVATLVGDPPNILIGSAADLSFVDFLTHSLPVIVFAWVAATLLLWVMLRGQLKRGEAEAGEVTDEIHPREALKQPREARLLLAVLALAGVLFLLQEALGLSPAVIALGAAGLALVLVRPDVEATLDRVEWSVLVFFSGLFVMVGGLDASGVLDRIAEALAGLGSLDPVVLGIVVIWTVAALSAVVDNVPITIVVIPVISGLGAAGVDIEPIWWALAFGAGLGGNATVIGATANIVVVTQADRAGQPISSRQWVRYGIPVTVLTCAVASVGYAVAVTLFW
jgi:Na+/H+ antiporter NhaD/arsenite permease-like protein